MSVCTTSGLRSGEALNRQRLFVVCHKAVSEEMLARLFRTWPGLEYLDLKRDRATGEHPRSVLALLCSALRTYSPLASMTLCSCCMVR